LEDYAKVFKEWKSEGIIEEVPPNQMEVLGHYIPHRAVVKFSSETTKIRPVFDASAKRKGSPSLNDCLEKGPNLIDLIPSIMNRFRFRKIGVVSDIKKAFLQMSVLENDRDFMRFLWWSDSTYGDLKIFRPTLSCSVRSFSQPIFAWSYVELSS